jgi:hypothetical protein
MRCIVPLSPTSLMSSKPFTRSQARAAKHANNMETINAVADELVERARAEFEKQLTEARAAIVRDLLRDGAEGDAYIECGVSLQGAYDKKLDVVIVCNMYDGDCDCGECNGEECNGEECNGEECNEPEEPEEPAPEPVKCSYGEFEYRTFTLPPRQSQRINEMRKKAIGAEIGADKFAQWCATMRTYLVEFETAQRKTGYTKKASQLQAAIANYKYLLQAPESSAILRTFPHMATVTRLKAEDLREHCNVMLNHMHAKCGCHDSYTRAQEDEIEALANELISLCGAYLARR